jgi:hypothetical protein
MLSVYKFNQVRNGFTLDEQLEKDMLLEEIQEFYEGRDLAERVDARLDVDYVFRGTMMKFNFAGKNVSAELFTLQKEFITVANAVLVEEFGNNQQLMNKLMKDCWDIVCECNALKVAELDENGKVIKQHDLPNATDLIRAKLTDAGVMGDK